MYSCFLFLIFCFCFVFHTFFSLLKFMYSFQWLYMQDYHDGPGEGDFPQLLCAWPLAIFLGDKRKMRPKDLPGCSVPPPPPVYVVVQFYPCFKFSLLLFLRMVMYDNNMIMSLKQKKRKFEPRIKLSHNIYTLQIISLGWFQQFNKLHIAFTCS